ncbi:MAG TPA: helix-turn-helix domain-containing protein [Pararobbsia sp.]|nr:helix-turn-helix domain-containing protein [Pararobbsia sp.]
MQNPSQTARPILLAPDFGAAFRRERKARGHTQQWIADHSGLSRFTITQLEAGENVGLHHILAALTALGKGLSIVSARPDYDQLREMFRDDE